MHTTTLNRLLHRFDGREMVPLSEAAPVISKTPKAIHKIRERGKLPFPVVPFPGAILVRLTDLANWIDTAATSVSGGAVQYAEERPVKAGRPTNSERAAATRLGLTVSEYRARAVEGGAR